MRKYIALLIALLFVSGAYAQTTAVTATITDGDGQTWNNGTWQAQLYNPTYPTTRFSLNGVVLTPQQTIASGSMNGAGVISATFYDTSQISPAGSTYQWTLCPNASATCASNGIYAAPVGSTINLSSALSANLAGPRFPAVGNSFGYLDVEIDPTPQPGATYYNVTTPIQRIWSGSAWGNNGGGGGPTGSGFALPSFPSSSGQLQTTNITTDATANNLFVPGYLSSPQVSAINVVYADYYRNITTCNNTDAIFNNTVTYAPCSLVYTSATLGTTATGSVVTTGNYNYTNGQSVPIPAGYGLATLTVTGSMSFGRSLYQGSTLCGTVYYQITGTLMSSGQYLLSNASACSSGSFTTQDNLLWLSISPNASGHIPSFTDGNWAFISYSTPMGAQLNPQPCDYAFGVARTIQQTPATSTGPVLVFGSASTTTGECVKGLPWELGVTNQTTTTATISLEGQFFNVQANSGSTISHISGSTIQEPMIVHYPDGNHGLTATGVLRNLELRNFTTTSFGETNGCFELDGMVNLEVTNVNCRDMGKNFDSYRFGSNGIAGGYSQQGRVHNLQVTAIVGGVSAWGRPGVTINLTSGSIPAGTSGYTINTGGSSIPSNAVAVFTGYGSHNGLACATMPDPPTLTIVSGALTALTQDSNGGVTCDGQLFVQIWPAPTEYSAFNLDSFSDAELDFLEGGGSYADCALEINHHGGNNFNFFHPVGGNGSSFYCGLRDGWGGNGFLLADFDTIDYINVMLTDTGGQHTGDTFYGTHSYWNLQSRPQKGAYFMYIAPTITNTPVTINTHNCASSGLQNQGGYAEFVGPNGVLGLPSTQIDIPGGFQPCSAAGGAMEHSFLGNMYTINPSQSTPQTIASATTLPIFASKSIILSGTASITSAPAPTGLQAQNEACYEVLASGAWNMSTGGNLYPVSSPLTAVVNGQYNMCWWPSLNSGAGGWTIHAGGAGGGTTYPDISDSAGTVAIQNATTTATTTLNVGTATSATSNVVVNIGNSAGATAGATGQLNLVGNSSASIIASLQNNNGQGFTLGGNGMMTATNIFAQTPIAGTVGTAIASASTIAPSSLITHITGTTTVNTITPFNRFDGSASNSCIGLVTNSAVPFTVAGNISSPAFTSTAGQLYMACYDGTKWILTGSGGSGGAVTSLTTTGGTGAATLTSGVLNIPNYSAGQGAGLALIATGATSVTISSSLVTATSVIVPSWDASAGPGLSATCNTTVQVPSVSARVVGTSFTISIPVAPITNPACIGYLAAF